MVLTIQQQFWDNQTQPPGKLNRTVDTQVFTFERGSSEEHSWVIVRLSALFFSIFVSDDSSPPSHENPVTQYEVVGKTVYFETSGGNPQLKTSLTFS